MALKNIYFDNWSEYLEFVDRMNQIVLKQKQKQTSELTAEQEDYLLEEARERDRINKAISKQIQSYPESFKQLA